VAKKEKSVGEKGDGGVPGRVTKPKTTPLRKRGVDRVRAILERTVMERKKTNKRSRPGP